MSDLDIPSRQAPIYRERLHWLVVNIKGNNISSGEERRVYNGPKPPSGAGI